MKAIGDRWLLLDDVERGRYEKMAEEDAKRASLEAARAEAASMLLATRRPRGSGDVSGRMGASRTRRRGTRRRNANAVMCGDDGPAS